jgi:uncharacterized membrane protein YbhN (UPF0104 family)
MLRIRSRKNVLPYLLTIAALAIFAFYLYHNAEQYQALLALTPTVIFSLLGLTLLFTFTNGLINYLFYRGLGVPLTLNEAIGLAAINTLANQLPFAGGMVSKGVYLKQRYQLTYTRYFSATTALYLCFVAANGLMGLLLLLYHWLVHQSSTPIILWLGFAAMTSTILWLWIPLDVKWIPKKWQGALSKVLNGWQVLSQNWPLVAQLVTVQLLMTILFATRLWIAFTAISQEVRLSQCLLFASATILTRLVSISPGSLGIREGIVAAMAALLGIAPSLSVVAVALDRLISLFLIIAIGTVYTFILSKWLVQTAPLSLEQQKRGKPSP